MFAAGNGHIDIIKLLLEAGIEKDTARFFVSHNILAYWNQRLHFSLLPCLGFLL
jgi:ankyrin repeat protein